MKKILTFIESVYDQLEDIECREEMPIANASAAIAILEDSVNLFFVVGDSNRPNSNHLYAKETVFLSPKIRFE